MSWLERLHTKHFEWNREDDGTGFVPASASRWPLSRGRDGLESNVVMAPVHWILRNFTEAQAVVYRMAQEQWKLAADFGLSRVLKKPNRFYGANLMWKATLVSAILDGNGYWRKIRNVFGEVLEYWYIPHFLMEPRWPDDGSQFIAHYDYTVRPGTQPIKLPPRDVVHFRYGGLDPENMRKGLSPVKPLLREIFTDEEAANFSATILGNMGVPGGVIAPASKDSLPRKEDVQEMKEYMKSGFSGRNRGEWLVLGTPTNIAQFGFDPNNLMLGNLRDISEERVCAMLGVPAAVVGFGAGLQQTKVGATMRELRQGAWHNCIIPLQNDLADQLTMQTMEDFTSQPNRYKVGFDRSMVSAFQEEETERANRLGILTEKGILRVDKAQELAGLEVDPSQAVYLRPSGVTAVAVGDSALAKDQRPKPAEPKDDDEEIPPAVAARMNGNGNHQDEE